MDNIKNIINNKNLNETEKLALINLAVNGEQGMTSIIDILNKHRSQSTRVMRKLESMGLVRGYKRTVAGRQGWDKVYAIAV